MLKSLLFTCYLLFTSILLPLPSWAVPKASSRVLLPIESIEIDKHLITDQDLFLQKKEILSRIVGTFDYLKSEEAEKLYSEYFDDSVSIHTVTQSLFSFYMILLLSPDFDTFISRVKKNFAVHKSIGQDGRGTVRFTGYFQPVYKASLVKTDKYRFPIFKKPADFESWQNPHPTRIALEGLSGLGGEGTKLQGMELAWLSSRYDVFMIQLQGSAILELTNNTKMSVGFSAGTNHPFRGVSRDFMKKHNVAWHKLGDFFSKHPQELNLILANNNRFIFFKENPTADAIGSLGVPVLAERSIATDRLKLPPGAVGLINTKIPTRNSKGQLVHKESLRFVLNLDTGSALKGPGRVDVYMGSGEEAKIKASSLYNTGELYYLFKKL